MQNLIKYWKYNINYNFGTVIVKKKIGVYCYKQFTIFYQNLPALTDDVKNNIVYDMWFMHALLDAKLTRYLDILYIYIYIYIY